MEQTQTFPTIVSSRRTVPNEQPFQEPGAVRIALIGEAPGEDEENHRRPFVGKSGQFLDRILRDVGIDRTRCLLGNVCQVRPPGNRIEAFAWDGSEIQEGLAKLNEDIRVYNPNICVLLGGTPLRGARGPCKITEWRGSLFLSNLVGSPTYGRKCLAALHPAFVLREFSGFPLLKFDLTRARQEAESPTLILPQRELLTNLGASELCYLMDTWPSGQRCSIDIEGGLPRDQVNEKRLKSKGKYTSKFGWPCVALAARPTKGITIVWNRFNEQDHGRVLQSFAQLMWRTDVPKVLQNQLSDNFTLSFGYGILIRNVTEDVMIKGWEIYAELPRALDVQASIWTRQPLWKDESMYGGDGEGLYRGCGLDVTCTLEICERQDSYMTGLTGEHYRKMIQIQNPFHYMEHRGIKYNQDNVSIKLKETIEGYTDTTGVWHEGLNQISERLEKTTGCSLRGPKGSLVPQRLVKVLYTEGINGFKYPPQYAKKFGRKTEELTTNIEALLTLKRHRPNDNFLSDIILHRHLEGVRETLQITADPDGRVRCGYSLEAETGRVKCYTSPTGSGANLQTIQKDLRGNYVADDDHDFFQCDLEGADGWTVACHLARLGDSTMLDDYLAGLKPAKIIGLYYWFGPTVHLLDRESLKHACDRIFPVVLEASGKWLYLGCKRVQHGSSYLMGIPTMQLNVLKDSHKESGVPVYMEASDARILQQDCLFKRYALSRWHNWAEAKLIADGKLTSASGHTRIFFGRRFGPAIKETVKEFLAHEPQNNTTWATNLAMLNLWNDPENRRSNGSLVIEPLHQVHDALCGQWPSDRRDWAKKKIRTYFNNTLTIAGRDIVIPFDGTWGKSWGDMPNKI